MVQVTIVMEYCDGGDLQAYLKKRRVVDEPEAVRLLTQLLVALKFIHGQQVSPPARSILATSARVYCRTPTLFTPRACR